MKKKFIPFSALFLLLIAFVACNNEKEDYFDEPIDVPFTVFSISEGCSRFSPIPETLCGFRVSDSRYNISIINSDEEFRNHIICREDNDLPVIDFSQYTLLLARGVEGGGRLFPHSINLQQHSSQGYVMNVHIGAGGLAVITYWHVAVITDKLNKDARIRLNVTLN